MLNQSAEHDLGQDFPCDGEERYPAAVTADCSVSFLLVNDHEVSILPVLWEGPMFPDVLDQEVLTTCEDVSSVFEMAGVQSKVEGCPGAWMVAGLADYPGYVGQQGWCG